MDGVSASHGRNRRRDTGLTKLISSTLRVFDFSKGRNRNVEALASFLLILYFLWMMRLLPSKPFVGRFHTRPVPNALTYAVIIRIFSSFRCQIRSTGPLHKLIQSALMGLETLASLFLACGLLLNIGVEYISQTDPDPGEELDDLSWEIKQCLLAHAVWVFVSALHRRIRGRNSDLSKLIQSAGIVLTYTALLCELDNEIVVGAFMIWLAMSVLGLNFWIEGTGGTEHLREWGMSLFGRYLFYEGSNFTWPILAAVWIGLSTFYGKCETLARDGRDAAQNGYVSMRNRNVAALASLSLSIYFLWMMGLLPSKPFAGRFHTHPIPNALTYAVVFRIFSSFRCQIRSTGPLHKLIQSTLMGLETLASLFLACGTLGIGARIWAEYTGQIGPDPGEEPEDFWSELEQLFLALAVWVFVSALHSRIRGRNSDLSKLIQSAGIVLTYTALLSELDYEVVVGAFMIWLTVSVLGLNLWIEATGGTVHLRECGMSLFGYYQYYEGSNFTWPILAAVWIGLSAFYGKCERLARDGRDAAQNGVRDDNHVSMRNRNVAALASLSLSIYFLWMMGLLPSKPFAGRFHTHPVPNALTYVVVFRIFSSFRCQIRSTGPLHKLIQSALMGLETLASLFLVCGSLVGIGAHILAEYTGQIGPDPGEEPEDFSPMLEQLYLALAVWVFVSALHSRIRGRNSDLSKLIQSAGIVLTYTTLLSEFDYEVVVGAFMIWLTMSVLGLNLWIEATGGTVHLRECGMSLFGYYQFNEGSNFTWPILAAVWIGLSAFYSKCETLARDGRDAAHNVVRDVNLRYELTAASSLSISTLAEKEVYAFLSVNRGPDVRDEFVDFLLVQLTRSGISVFGEGSKLPEGEELVEVINRSKIFIPIISKGYASSESCLVELSLMLECRRTNGQTIIPIFYDVDPSDVRQVRGSFEMSLEEHEMKGTDGRTIHAWRRALREVGGLERFYCADKNYGYSCKLVEQLVLDVLQLLGKSDTGVKENFVGIQDQIQEVMTKLGVYYRDGQLVGLHGGDVRVVGIYGAGGVGKTTLAKVVYEDIASLFDACSYLEDIQERFTESEGLESLQNQLISDLLKRSCIMFKYEEGAHIIKHRFHSTRVLIILDGVNHHHQLDLLIGELSWFGPRSRIIVTTRDYGLINIPKVAEKYEVEPLRPDQSIFLFRRHASNGQPFPKEDGSLSDEIVSVTGRIPLAIIALGSLLCKMAPNIWHDRLKILSKCVDPVESVFMASFEFLNDETREILLDIACFFVGKDISKPLSMWDACGYDPLSGIKVLLDMSLVQIRENNKLWMHDQLRYLCQQIIKNKDPESPERHSRLWNYEDAVSLLKERKGTKRVQALNLRFDNRRHDCSAFEEFELLPGLRFLKLGKTKITGDCKKSPSNLRWLDWQGCPEIFGDRDLHLRELVILDLSWSKLANDWKGWSQIKMPQLKILNLTGCTGLLMTPDLSGFEKLEILILEHCSRLVSIDASIAQLKCLVTLNLKFCSELSRLPKGLSNMKELKELLIDGTSIKEIPSTLANMKKLKTLSASNCFSLSSLPESIGQLEDLSVLLLDSAKIAELPGSIGELAQLKQLSLRNCRFLWELPDSIGKLGSTLIELDVSGTGISELPGSIRNLQNLKVLKMDSSFMREFPRNIGRLTKLEEVHAFRCRSLEGDIPSDIGELKSLRMLVLGYTHISSLPSGIQSLCCLQTLDLLHCDRIEALPSLPSSLSRLRVISRSMKVMPFIDHLTKLEELCIGNEDPEELELLSTQRRWMNSILTREVGVPFLGPKRFPRLKVLELSHSRIMDLNLRDECFPQLTKLVISGANLRRVPQLPSTLWFLSVRGCLSLERLPNVQFLKSLTELRLSHSAVRQVEGLGELEALEILDISHCEIRNLEGLGQLGSLISLMLSDCDYLRKLPNISNLRRLKVLEIRRCREIKNIPGLQGIRSNLEKLHVGERKDENSPEVAPERIHQNRLLSYPGLKSELYNHPKGDETGNREKVRPM